MNSCIYECLLQQCTVLLSDVMSKERKRVNRLSVKVRFRQTQQLFPTVLLRLSAVAIQVTYVLKVGKPFILNTIILGLENKNIALEIQKQPNQIYKRPSRHRAGGCKSFNVVQKHYNLARLRIIRIAFF